MVTFVWKFADTAIRAVYESVCRQRGVLLKQIITGLPTPPCHVRLDGSCLLVFFCFNARILMFCHSVFAAMMKVSPDS